MHVEIHRETMGTKIAAELEAVQIVIKMKIPDFCKDAVTAVIR